MHLERVKVLIVDAKKDLDQKYEALEKRLYLELQTLVK